MVGIAHECELQPVLAGIVPTTPSGRRAFSSIGPCSNAELHIGEDVSVYGSLRNFCWIQTKVCKSLAYSASLRILAAEQFFIQAAHQCAAAR